MKSRINDDIACVVCARMAKPFAVGMKHRLGWYCESCGPTLARSIMALTLTDLNAVEQAACKRVADTLINDSNDDPVAIPRHEMPLFVHWVIEEFSKEMRTMIQDGEIPF